MMGGKGSVDLVFAHSFSYYGLPQPFTAFALFAIASTFWFGGTKPGILATLISWLARDCFIEPEISAEFRILYCLVFFVFALVMTLAMQGRNELKARVAERTAELLKTNEDLTLEIARRKGTEEALRRSEAYLAESQKLSHTGTWAFNPTMTLYWSEENYRIWGFDPLQGLPSRETVWLRIHPGDRDRVLEEIREALRQNKSYAGEFRILLPDGTTKYIEATSRHIFSVYGELVEVVGTHVDVTERQRARKERERLRQLEADLAHMNRLSTMGELAASLAHEVKQPIAAARNNARAALNFLDRCPPDLGEVREALSCVAGDADRAGHIVDRVRDCIKKAPPRQDRFDLNKAVNEVIALARSEVANNGVSVQTRLAAGLSPVRGDRVQLQQVVLNFVMNAVEAMSSVGEGGRELLISSEQSHGDGVLVAVRDSGPGIDPKHLNRIFEAFYTTKARGIGMGLSICRSIIDAHGGRLWAEANEPRGAVFQFTLPAAEG